MRRRGFFSEAALLQSAPPSRLPQCGKCGLYKTCNSPKMEPTGKGRKKILIVAEAPGENEDDRGIQLCGKAGQTLEKILRKHGVDMRKDCWLTNSLICRPPDNATPTDQQIGYCRPNLVKSIERFKPHTIMLLGGVAVKSAMNGPLWGGDVGLLSRWTGWQIPNQKHNVWICPTWHPSYLNRMNDPLLEMLFSQHIEAAAGLTGRPWDTVPRYKDQIEIIKNHRLAAKLIREFTKKGGKAAFDYETNMLKPDRDNAEIVSCSICWRGERTIAYPWYGEAVDATREFLRSRNIRKIGSNIKFEERWTRRILHCSVREWFWDTMLAAHWLDNRKGITGIEFQALLWLGQDVWDREVRDYLSSKGSNNTNRIKEIDLSALLLYNGMDSLLEYLVARRQRKCLPQSHRQQSKHQEAA